MRMKKTSRVFGLKSHGERIKRRTVSFDELEQMTFADMKTFAIVQWFLNRFARGGNSHADHQFTARSGLL